MREFDSVKTFVGLILAFLADDATCLSRAPLRLSDSSLSCVAFSPGAATLDTSIGHHRDADPSPARRVVAQTCLTASGNPLATASPSNASNFASQFTDEFGNPTDYAGYLAATDRMETGIQVYGEAAWYLRRQTGLDPALMRFGDEGNSTEPREPFATAHSSAAGCSGNALARVEVPNRCYATAGAGSFWLRGLPPRCVLEWFASGDCSGGGSVAAVSDSCAGCYAGTAFNSMRLKCVVTPTDN